MDTLNPNLKALIKEFQATVSKATSLFQKYRGFSNISEWRQQQMKPTGSVDEANLYRYYFHGIGCAFHFPDGDVIDWDWGLDGRIDGFDFWRLSRFWEERKKMRA